MTLDIRDDKDLVCNYKADLKKNFFIKCFFLKKKKKGIMYSFICSFYLTSVLIDCLLGGLGSIFSTVFFIFEALTSQEVLKGNPSDLKAFYRSLGLPIDSVNLLSKNALFC